MLRAIVFDYGRVLTMPPTEEDWAKLAGFFGVSTDVFQKAYWGRRELYDLARMNAETYWTAVAEDLGRKVMAAEVEVLTTLDNTQWTRANPEMLEFAWRAQKRGVRIGILSNMQFDMLAAMRRKFDWLDRFDSQAYTCEIGAVKPEPESFQFSLKALGVHPEEALFFDDKQVNIDGALAIGMKAMLFTGDVNRAYAAVEKLGVTLGE